MVNPFNNPVTVWSGTDAVECLTRVLVRQPYVLVTSKGWWSRGVPQRIISACGMPVAIVDKITENPTVEDIISLEPQLTKIKGQVHPIVALGGGSVLDSAKIIAAVVSPETDTGLGLKTMLHNPVLPQKMSLPPLFCIPTTAGSGSEVTNTATIWDRKSGNKFSLSHPKLFPTVTILDPTLTAMAPAPLTIATTLDALSHAMESIWNINHNPVADSFACSAIAAIKKYLPLALSTTDIEPRRQLQIASILAGYAISSTQTALAHSISYPLTARFGLRHGIACGFLLPEVAAYNLVTSPERVQIIADVFGGCLAEFPYALRKWLKTFGVYESVLQVVDPQKVAPLGTSLITPSRADNNIRSATVADAHSILYAALSNGASRQVSETMGNVIWITGLSGVGKTTLARQVVNALREIGRRVVLLDGDELRGTVSGTVGFTEAERRRLAKRYGELCRVLSLEGMDTVCSTMSLFHDCQEWNRANISRYLEVYLKADMETLIARDFKDIYRRGLNHELSHVVGIDLVYEEPLFPDLLIDTSHDNDLQIYANQIVSLLRFGSQRSLHPCSSETP